MKMTDKVNNLIVRSITGVAFVTVLVGCIVWSPLSFTLLFAVITTLSVKEFCQIVNRRADVHVNTAVCTVSGLYLFMALSGFCTGLTPTGIFIPYLLSIVYLLISELYLKSKHALNNWAFTMMSQMYVALPFATLNILAFQTEPTYGSGVAYNYILPLSVFIFLWSSDTGAYCFGSLFGRHKLFPRISPHKSWEGSVGGGLTALAASLAISFVDASLPAWQWAGLALVVVVFGTWGDLVESLLKRQMGIKDSGTILPGHGGMLDRFDSSLLAVPAAVIYLYTLTLW